MSLYNLLFGQNEYADILLGCLGYTQSDIPRYRDCYLRNNSIIIYTRTGGGNRDAYENENNQLRLHNCYITDYDDGSDSTYANFVYKFPEEYAKGLKALVEKDDSYMPSEKWKILLNETYNKEKHEL